MENKLKADVINIMPVQMSGKISFAAGLTDDKGWCPIGLGIFEFTIYKNIHIIWVKLFKS